MSLWISLSCLPYSLFALISGASLFSFAPIDSIENAVFRGIIAGFGTLVYFVISAMVMFLTGRLLSELLSVIYSIANDIHIVAANSPKHTGSHVA